MRKLIGALVATGLALSLSACGESDETPTEAATTPSATPSEATPTETPTGEPVVISSAEGMPSLMTGEDGFPLLEFPDSKAPADLQISVLDEGTGREITAADYLLVDYVGQVWGNDVPFDSSFARGTSAGFWLDKLVPGWTHTLVGQKAGAKVIISLPPEYGYQSKGQPNAGIKGTDTIVFYIEVHDAWDMESAGQPDASVESNVDELPVSIEGTIGSPVTALAIKAGAEAPQELSTKVIAKGSGDAVPTENAIVYVHYAAVSWDGERTENSWLGIPAEYTSMAGPQAIQIGNGTVFDSLAGIPTGSRVLLLVPATEATDDSTTSMPAMAVVVDILAVAPTTPVEPSE